jgi:hypothetical protein
MPTCPSISTSASHVILCLSLFVLTGSLVLATVSHLDDVHSLRPPSRDAQPRSHQLHWGDDDEDEDAALHALKVVSAIFVLVLFVGAVAAVAGFVSNLVFGRRFVTAENVLATILSVSLCLVGLPLVLMFPAVSSVSYLTNVLIMIRTSQVLIFLTVLEQLFHLAQVRMDRVKSKLGYEKAEPPQQELKIVEDKEYVSIGVGPEEVQVEVEGRDAETSTPPPPKPERRMLEHRITRQELWVARDRLRKISADTLDSVFAGFEMPVMGSIDMGDEEFLLGGGQEDETEEDQGKDEMEEVDETKKNEEIVAEEDDDVPVQETQEEGESGDEEEEEEKSLQSELIASGSSSEKEESSEIVLLEENDSLTDQAVETTENEGEGEKSVAAKT